MCCRSSSAREPIPRWTSTAAPRDGRSRATCAGSSRGAAFPSSTPSMEAPWGWQIDGHHLIVNCFVLKDQIVLTPSFMGAELIVTDRGPYAGTQVLQEEERSGWFGTVTTSTLASCMRLVRPWW